MVQKIGSSWHNRYFGWTLIWLSALTLNSWLLAPFLNRELFIKNGSISEYNALGQPHFWIFRGLDILSGCLLVLVALIIRQKLSVKVSGRNFLAGTAAVWGVASIVDSLIALPCSYTLDSSCNIPVNISLSHFQMPGHGYSSIVIAMVYFLLPLAGFLYATSHKLRSFMLISALLILVALESFVSAITEYTVKHAFTVKATGAGQELQLVLLGIWLIAWYASTTHQGNTAETTKATVLYNT
jgi:hypothetical protein